MRKTGLAIAAIVCTTVVGYQGFRRLRLMIGAGRKKREERKTRIQRLADDRQKASPAPKPTKSCLKTPESVPRNVRVRFEGVKCPWVPPSVRRKREEQSRLAKEKWQGPNSPSPSTFLVKGLNTTSNSHKDLVFEDTQGSEELEGVQTFGIRTAVTQSPSDIVCQDESLERTDSVLSAVSIEPLVILKHQKEESVDVSCATVGESLHMPISGHEPGSLCTSSPCKGPARFALDARQGSPSESESSSKLAWSPKTDSTQAESKPEGEQATGLKEEESTNQDPLPASSELPALPLQVSPEEIEQQVKLWEEIKSAQSTKPLPQQEDAPRLKTKFPLKICREPPKPNNPPPVTSGCAKGRRATWEEKGKWPAEAWREKDPSLLTEPEKKLRDEEIAEEAAERSYEARAVAYWKSKAPVYPNNPAGTSKSHGMHKVSAMQPNTASEPLGDFPSLQSVHFVNGYSRKVSSEFVASQEQVEEQKRRWAEFTGRQ
eukprot:jgi/Picsp_1/4906/NSC_02270-R1_---NA---